MLIKHFYVSDEATSVIHSRARQAHMPVSKFLAEMIRKEVVQSWPEGWFDQVFGSWEGERLSRQPQAGFEVRETLD